LVLIIEDEPQMRRFLSAALGTSFRLLEATTGTEGLTQAASYNPDVVLLDLGLPDLDGLAVTQRLREWSKMPVIVLSARGQEQDKIAALDAGADDYLTKPFSVPELLARMRVALRHVTERDATSPEPVATFGDLQVDLARRTVMLAGGEVRLTPTEYRILAVLVKHAGRVLTHRQLLKEVWGAHSSVQAHNLRVHVATLRHKIEKDPARPVQLLTEPGVGYRFRDG
jgi:two-component system KDP operon response regulator KdpE